jgi:hypothetical protein
MLSGEDLLHELFDLIIELYSFIVKRAIKQSYANQVRQSRSRNSESSSHACSLETPSQ